jgi:hypothetical protein
MKPVVRLSYHRKNETARNRQNEEHVKPGTAIGIMHKEF